MGSDKTVIRAGYGILHDSSWNQGGQGLWQNPPYYAEVDPCPSNFCLGYNSAFGSLSGGFLVDPSTAASTPVAGGAVLTSPVNPANYTGTIQSMNRNFQQGMVQQFNLNVEHQLPGNVVLTAGYAGTRSTHILVGQSNENLSSPSACGSGRWLHRWMRLPILSLCGTISAGRCQQQRGQGSLRLACRSRLRRRARATVFMHCWAIPTRAPSTPACPTAGYESRCHVLSFAGYQKLDWGLSQLNLNDSFTASVLYDLPFGKGKTLRQ